MSGVRDVAGAFPRRSPNRLYLLPPPPPPFLQSKACARVWKRDWWTWPCGWAPAQITPEATHPPAGTRCPESSSRNCPSKESDHDQMALVRLGPAQTACHLAHWNDGVRFAGKSHSITDENLNVFFSPRFNTMLAWRLRQKNAVIIVYQTFCTVSSLLIGAGAIQESFKRRQTHCWFFLLSEAIMVTCCHFFFYILIKISFF